MAGSMKGPRLGFFSKVSIASIATSFVVVRKAPQFAVCGSFFWTVCSFYGLFVFAFSFYWMILYPKLLSPIRHLPGPKGGNLLMGHWFTIMKAPTGEPLREWVQEIPNDGIIRYLGLFNGERILLASPKALAEVLVSHSYDYIKPDAMARSLSRLTGTGLLLSEGDLHRFQRKNLTPAFSFRHVKELYPTFWAKAIEMVDVIERDLRANLEPAEATKTREQSHAHFFQQEVTSELYEAEQRSLRKSSPAVLEFSTYSSRATLDIIGVAGMGYDFGTLAEPNSPLATNYQKVFEMGGYDMLLNILTLLLPFWLVKKIPLKRNREIEEASTVVRQVCLNLILRKRAEKAESHDILSTAIESGAFQDENLVDQLMTFLAAGHETTATSLSWAVYHLSLHPELQARLRAEIRSKLPSPDSDQVPTSNELDSLPLLNAFCNEVLRFYSPIPLTYRNAREDTVICGHQIPAKTLILVSPAAVNHSPELWGASANQFDIERWLAPGAAGSGGAKSNYANLTFLHGPRSCIGKDFARGEFAALVAVLVGRMDIRAVDPTRKMNHKGVTSKPVGGVTVAFRAIEGW